MRRGRTRCNGIVTSGFSGTITFSDLLVGPLKSKACLDSLAAGWALGYPTPVPRSPYLHMRVRTHTHTRTHLLEAPKGIFCVSCSQVDGQAGLAGPDSIGALLGLRGALRLCCEPPGSLSSPLAGNGGRMDGQRLMGQEVPAV